MTRRPRRSPGRGFTLLEAAIALVALAALTGAGVAGVREAQTEFEHSQHRTTVSNLLAATTTDAASRGHQFEPDLLGLYTGGGRYAIAGVETIHTSRAAVSDAPGELVAWISGDQLVISLAMLSTRSRCLQALTVAGQMVTVTSTRTSPCRPILPAALYLDPGAPAPAAPTGLLAVPGNGEVELSWTPLPGEVAYLAHVAPNGATCETRATSCVITLPAGEYSATLVAANAAGMSPPSQPPVPFTVTAAPSAPTGLVATPGIGQVTLSWTLPADNGSPLSGHRILVHADGEWIELEHGAAPTATVADLTPGVTYAFRVAGVNGWGVGAYSDTVSVAVFSAPLPPGLTVTGGDTELTVTLTDPPGAATWPGVSYTVAYHDGSGNWIELVRPAAGTFTISGLQPGVTYSVRARTRSDIGDSDWSETITRPTIPTVPSPALSTAATTVTVTWPPVTGATGYVVTRSSGESSPSIVYSGADTTVADAVSPDTTYTYRVRACNTSGCSADSAPQNITAVPSAPTITTVTAGDATLTVAFTHAATASLTMIEYSTDGGITWRARSAGTTGSPLTITTRSSDDAPLQNGTMYLVRLRGVSAAGAGAESNLVSATPVTTPGAPTISSVTAGTLSLSVAFTAPTATGGSALTTYEYSTDDGDTWRERGTGTTDSPLVITSQSGNGSALVAATTYTIRIRAVSAVGAGAAAASATGTPYNAPGAPTISSATGGTGSISVSFTAAAANGSNITTYEYSTDNGATWRTRATGTTASPLVITTRSGDNVALANGTTYSVRIRAVNAAGAGASSAAASATTVMPATTITAMSCPGGTGVCNFSWQQVAGAVSYRFNFEALDTVWPYTQTNQSVTTTSASRQGRLGRNRVQVQVCGPNACSTFTAWSQADAAPTPTPLVVVEAVRSGDNCWLTAQSVPNASGLFGDYFIPGGGGAIGTASDTSAFGFPSQWGRQMVISWPALSSGEASFLGVQRCHVTARGHNIGGFGPASTLNFGN